ncbi:MAG: hypothetical protein AAGG72_01955, partial [Pseudomonadota bacterium]
MMKQFVLAIASAVLMSQAGASLAQNTEQKIEQALQLEYRTEAERARDRNRRADRALAFMGLEDDMKVFEFGPGGGWYTKILAPVLKDNGELIVGYPEDWLADLGDLRSHPQYDEVREVDMAMGWDEDELA